jgi:uncharacterized protein with FMN-binding domain
MLRPDEKRDSLAGKLLLSSALVVVSVAFGWWQRQTTAGPVMAAASMAAPPAPTLPTRNDLAMAAPPVAASSAAADASVSSEAPDAGQATAAPAAPKPTAVAKAEPPANMPADVPTAPQQQTALLPASPPAAIYQQIWQPTNDVSPPIPLVTGTPAPGVTPSIPASAGNHLLDGDYVSDRHQLEWGDLRVKISVRGGQITGVQILQYPDHRSHSLDLSLMAGPTLESEVIKTQRAQVDAVSSATDTSYAFQDTIADAIVKAARE